MRAEPGKEKADYGLSAPGAAELNNIKEVFIFWLYQAKLICKRPNYSILQSNRQSACEEGGGGGKISSLFKNLEATRRLLQGPETSNTANESGETADLCQSFFQPSLYLELHQTVTFFKNNSLSS